MMKRMKKMHINPFLSSQFIYKMMIYYFILLVFTSSMSFSMFPSMKKNINEAESNCVWKDHPDFDLLCYPNHVQYVKNQLYDLEKYRNLPKTSAEASLIQLTTLLWDQHFYRQRSFLLSFIQKRELLPFDERSLENQIGLTWNQFLVSLEKEDIKSVLEEKIKSQLNSILNELVNHFKSKTNPFQTIDFHQLLKIIRPISLSLIQNLQKFQNRKILFLFEGHPQSKVFHYLTNDENNNNNNDHHHHIGTHFPCAEITSLTKFIEPLPIVCSAQYLFFDSVLSKLEQLATLTTLLKGSSNQISFLIAIQKNNFNHGVEEWNEFSSFLYDLADFLQFFENESIEADSISIGTSFIFPDYDYLEDAKSAFETRLTSFHKHNESIPKVILKQMKSKDGSILLTDSLNTLEGIQFTQKSLKENYFERFEQQHYNEILKVFNFHRKVISENTERIEKMNLDLVKYQLMILDDLHQFFQPTTILFEAERNESLKKIARVVNTLYSSEHKREFFEILSEKKITEVDTRELVQIAEDYNKTICRIAELESKLSNHFPLFKEKSWDGSESMIEDISNYIRNRLVKLLDSMNSESLALINFEQTNFKLRNYLIVLKHIGIYNSSSEDHSLVTVFNDVVAGAFSKALSDWNQNASALLQNLDNSFKKNYYHKNINYMLNLSKYLFMVDYFLHEIPRLSFGSKFLRIQQAHHKNYDELFSIIEAKIQRMSEILIINHFDERNLAQEFHQNMEIILAIERVFSDREIKVNSANVEVSSLGTTVLSQILALPSASLSGSVLTMLTGISAATGVPILVSEKVVSSKQLSNRITEIIESALQKMNRKLSEEIAKIEDELAFVISQYTQSKVNGNSSKAHLQLFAKLLMKLNVIGEYHTNFADITHPKIRQWIEKIYKQHNFDNDILVLTTLIESIAPEILFREGEVFTSSLNRLRHKHAAQLDFSGMIDRMKFINDSSLDLEDFRKSSEYVYRAFENLIDEKHFDELDVDGEQYLKETIFPSIQQLIYLFKRDQSQNMKQVVLDLLIRLMTVVAIRNPGFRPHPIQTLAIMRLFGVGTSPTPVGIDLFSSNIPFPNQLLQVESGDGKHFILSMTASIFALLGFDVTIMCSNKHLQQRDRYQFQSFYEYLNISNQIHYETIESFIEEMILTDLREIILSAVNNNTLQIDQRNTFFSIQNNNRILLLDEIDEFMKKDFYQNEASVAIQLKHPEISDFLFAVWTHMQNHEDNGFHLEDIKHLPEYFRLLMLFPQWKFLFENTIQGLYKSLRTIGNEQSSPIVNHDTTHIEYTHGLKNNAMISYETTFLSLHELCSLKSPDEHSCNEAKRRLSWNIHAGFISNDLFRNSFSTILGVSGTISSFSSTKKERFLNFFQMKTETHLPPTFSPFSDRFMFFKNRPDYFKIIYDDNPLLALHTFHKAIKQEIEDRLKSLKTSESDKNVRAVIVFFESESALELFTASEPGIELIQSMEQTLAKVNIIKSSHDSVTQIEMIKRAVMQGTITLAAKEFGFGTDFTTYNKQLDQHGGIHVLQTFFSNDLSEEVHIQRRTARNNNRGSYSMVLLAKDLMNKFAIPLEQMKEIISSMKPYNELHKIRLLRNEEEAELMTISSASLQRHQRTMKLFQVENIEELKNELEFHSKEYSQSKGRRILFLIDQGSRDNQEYLLMIRKNLQWMIDDFIEDHEQIALMTFESSHINTSFPMQKKSGNEEMIQQIISNFHWKSARESFHPPYNAIFQAIQYARDQQQSSHNQESTTTQWKDLVIVIIDGNPSNEHQGIDIDASAGQLESEEELIEELLPFEPLPSLMIIGIGSDFHENEFEKIISLKTIPHRRLFHLHDNHDEKSLRNAFEFIDITTDL